MQNIASTHAFRKREDASGNGEGETSGVSEVSRLIRKTGEPGRFDLSKEAAAERAALKADSDNQEREGDLPLWFAFQGPDIATRLGAGVLSTKAQKAINRLVPAIVSAGECGRSLSISRSKTWWAGTQRYHGTGYQAIRDGLDFLASHGWICMEVPPPAGPIGWQTTLTPSLALYEAVQGVALHACPLELIIMKDQHKRLMGYRDDRDTSRLRREVRQSQEFLSSANINLARVQAVAIKRSGGLYVFEGVNRAGERTQTFVDLTRPWSHRVIHNNGDWRQGGRIYLPVQNLPRSVRRQLEIDGEPVTEPDFSEQHVRMLYARVGHPMPQGRAYVLDNFRWPDWVQSDKRRTILKRTILIMVNASTTHAAAGAVERVIYDLCPYSMLRRSEARSLARAVIKAMQEKHHAISEFICSGEGLRLQRKDRDIMLKVLKDTRDRGIAAIPVHDSVMCSASQADRVREIMDKHGAPYGCKVSDPQ